MSAPALSVVVVPGFDALQAFGEAEPVTRLAVSVEHGLAQEGGLGADVDGRQALFFAQRNFVRPRLDAAALAVAQQGNAAAVLHKVPRLAGNASAAVTARGALAVAFGLGRAAHRALAACARAYPAGFAVAAVPDRFLPDQDLGGASRHAEMAAALVYDAASSNRARSTVIRHAREHYPL